MEDFRLLLAISPLLTQMDQNFRSLWCTLCRSWQSRDCFAEQRSCLSIRLFHLMLVRQQLLREVRIGQSVMGFLDDYGLSASVREIL